MKNGKLIILLLIVIIVLCLKIKDVRNDSSEDCSKGVDMGSGEQTQILLYFSGKDNTSLVKEHRYVEVNKIKDSMLETIINELLKGPAIMENVRTIPEGTRVIEIKQNDTKVMVNFSKEYIGNEEDEQRRLHKIYSVVNTLTEIKEIEEVEIRVEGSIYACEKRI